MLTKQYGKEPLDLQLFILLLIRKLWIIALGGIIGGLIIGGTYYLKNVVFAPVHMFEMVTEYYMEYNANEEGQEYTIFNQYTWENMIYSDDILDMVLLNLSESQDGLEEPINKEQLKESISATLLSDTRILTTTVVGKDAEIVEKINNALLFSLGEFGKNQIEFVSIRTMKLPEEATLQNLDLRVLNAIVLGLLVGLGIAGFCVVLFIIWDDRIYVPDIFEKRYSIPMLGGIHTLFCKENAKEMIKEGERYTVILLDEKTSLRSAEKKEIWESITGETNIELDSITLLNNPIWETSNISKLEKGASILLLVSAVKHNCKLIETTLQFIEKKQGRVLAGVLIEENKKLQKQYYFPAFMWSRKYAK